jgi:hypothetical protein
MKNVKTLFAAVFCATLSFGSFSQSETIIVDDDGNLIRTEDNIKNVPVSPEFYKIPLKDENGTAISITLEDGTESFVYQSPLVKLVQSDIPLVDNNGDPIIITLDDGTQIFTYPPPTIDPTQFDASLVDKTGNHAIITLEDGTKSYLYPPQN